MNFLDNIKRFLFGNNIPNNNRQNESSGFFSQYHDRDSDDDNFEKPSRDDFTRSFDVFTDPLQMQQYFEQQMNEMLRNFGFTGFGSNFFNDMPAIDGSPQEQPQSGELRDQFLRRGYEKPLYSSPEVEKVDKDIDDKIRNRRDLDSIFGGKENQVPNKPRFNFSGGNGSFFQGKSLSTKIIRGPDGSVETHSTVRDHEGNEETTVKKTVGDKEVSIVKKKDKFGKEEIIENFVNIDESEIDKFLPYDRNK